MVERTQFSILGIVAAVAIVSIIAMSLHTVVPQTSGPLSYEPIDESSRITGNAVRSASVVTGQGDHDLNGDGLIDGADSSLLSAVSRGDRCPPQKDCDLNNDGSVDINDVALINAIVLRTSEAPEEIAATQEPKQSLPVAVPGALA